MYEGSGGVDGGRWLHLVLRLKGRRCLGGIAIRPGASAVETQEGSSGIGSWGSTICCASRFIVQRKH